MKLQLPDNVSSPQDLQFLMLEIRQYARWLAHNDVKKRLDVKAADDSPVMSPAAIEVIRSWFGKKPISQESLGGLVSELEDFETTAPQLSITLAAAPSGGLKKTLIAWCREHVEPNVLVTFRFNSTLLGGMVVRYGSHVFDWSFRRQILAARGSFPEVLRRV